MNVLLTEPSSLESQLYQEFIMPSLCIELKKEGLTKNTIYTWRITNKTAVLFTTVFDVDDYYKEGIASIEQVTKPYVVPAYQLKDIEKEMRPYVLSKTHSGYRLLCTGCEIKAQRMPDVFALAFLHLVKHGMLNIDTCNQLINGI